MAISRLMRTLLSTGDESKRNSPYGDGEDTWRDYHVSDVCSGIEKALWRKKIDVRNGEHFEGRGVI